MDLGLFFGRFHPLVVHLPIGFLLLAALFEGASRFKQFNQLKAAVSWTLLLGAISAIVSVLFGFLIAGDRGYDDDVLALHKWFGISVVLLSIGLYLIEIGILKVSAKVMGGLFLALIVFLSLTGHLGGTLTHGEGYLVEHAPGFIKKIAGSGGKKLAPLDKVPTNPDSVQVFNDMILPIMETKCLPCHSETQAKGGLVLTSYEKLMEGGDGNASISPGKPLSSELFRRITLPVSHQKFMPLKEQPLAFTEVSLIQWWIEEGAKADSRLSQSDIPDHLSDLLMRDHKIDVTPKPYYEQASAPELDQSKNQLIESLSAFNIRKLSAKNNFLDVSVSQDLDKLSQADLDQLLQLKDNITWLDIKDKLPDASGLESISQLEHLTRLNLAGNPISDEHVGALSDLKYLESLNLVATNITDAGLEPLGEIAGLKRLYVWQTDVSRDAANEMMKNKGIEVVVGYQLAVENN